MGEFQSTGKDLERIRLAEEEARTTLLTFTDSNYKAIRALISHNKIIDAGGDIDIVQLGRLENFIQTESNGQLWGINGVLCEIGESGEEFARGHTGELFVKELGNNSKAVKGCYFSVSLGEQNFECVVLDGGGSRKYFDEKDKTGKRQYVERFANRRRDHSVFAGRAKASGELPLGFTAFLADTGEKLVVEELVGYRI